MIKFIIIFILLFLLLQTSDHFRGGRNRCLTLEERCDAWKNTKFFDKYFTEEEKIKCLESDF